MASNKKSQKQNPETEDEVIEGQEQTADEIETDATIDEPASIEEQNSEETVESSDESPIIPDEDAIPLMAPVPLPNLHQRLEALELSLLGKSAEAAWPINRITILTGTLKTALPQAIPHVEDEGLREGLKSLLDLL